MSELELLIEEQRRDDEAKCFWPQRDTVSLDAPRSIEGGSEWTLHDRVAIDADGYASIPSSAYRGTRLVIFGHSPHMGSITHGGSAYRNHGCRCSACRAGQAAFRRAWYAKRRAKPKRTLTCALEDCGRIFTTKQPHAIYCSRHCNQKAFDRRRAEGRKQKHREARMAVTA